MMQSRAAKDASEPSDAKAIKSHLSSTSSRVCMYVCMHAQLAPILGTGCLNIKQEKHKIADLQLQPWTDEPQSCQWTKVERLNAMGVLSSTLPHHSHLTTPLSRAGSCGAIDKRLGEWGWTPSAGWHVGRRGAHSLDRLQSE
eukprot:TRINITY_DN11780_c0_g1_i5.p2 TRINITY_DN11780_c0_g1~~TRINITY_DN11780_c0_g1_i5.p2  ORF type:complete len:142 (-),score=0.56 TRINITY_DN11780_c0_g1_i5:1814-2239(-)